MIKQRCASFGVIPPIAYRFRSGAVVDSQGHSTGQLDIVVEFPFFASFAPPGSGERL
jgi:hypothetical protein